ncbi:MAG TPA: hypothetical protein VD763_13235 [Candidatus Saccharimonadales bacterium]|nr:hypothetical protein [Candidatus Saccharimonadales bacterium]
MYHPDQSYQIHYLPDEPVTPAPVVRGCLQEGCECRDVRIVSNRKAAFFAAMARRAGETADRVITPEPGWTLPTGDLA